jgi:hypothetical protein
MGLNLLSSRNILLEAECYAREKFGKRLDSEIVQIFLSAPMFKEFAKLRGIPNDRDEVIIDEGSETKIYIQSDLSEDIKGTIAYRVGQHGNLFFPFSGESVDYDNHFCHSKSSLF